MNVDTDTQYAFTRPVAGHMFANYDGVLKVDGEVGNKKAYDPRAWGKAAEAGHGRPRRRGLREPPQRRDARLMSENLLGIPETLLHPDPAAALLDQGEDPRSVAAQHPSSSLVWAVLAEDALDDGRTIEGTICRSAAGRKRRTHAAFSGP